MTLLKYIVSLSILIFIYQLAVAQDEFIHKNQLWFGYVTTGKISNEISLWNDAQFVPGTFFSIRTGVNYHFKLNDKIKGNSTLGFAHIWMKNKTPVSSLNKEYRPWGQTMITYKRNKFSFFHRLRYDARFIQIIEDKMLLDEFRFNWRFRYFFMTKYQLHQNRNNQNEWYGYGYSEILYDYSPELENHFRLNQTRISLGIGYKHENISVQLGYLNMIKNPPIDGKPTIVHTPMLMVVHKFDFSCSSS